MDGNNLNNKASNLKQIVKDERKPMRVKRKIVATNLVTGRVTEYDPIYEASKGFIILIPALLN